jgi:hypothetical protein
MSPKQVTQIHTALGIRTAAGLLSHTPRSLSPARPMAMSTINPLPQMTRQGILQTRHTPPAMQSIAHCTHSSPARRHRECQFLLISPHPLAQEFASPINVARKRKTSTAEDLMDLIAMLPCWAGIALALTSYMVLHSIAIRPLPAAFSPYQIGRLSTTAIWHRCDHLFLAP